MKVYDKRCDQCLFGETRVVSPARAAAIIADCASKGSHFICHKASIAGEDVMCRGQYDAIVQDLLPAPQLLRVARRLGGIEFVPVPKAGGTPKATSTP